ncbi:PREDICTED: F-box only protein 9-like, partial [Acropora digitifera]|uniref:F-box only protein 9-like n=1 Tax=Acropora digitifera TaxID=70779 RepID=UPI00077A6810
YTNLYTATYFYRQALQLVPDIESKIKDFTNFNLESEDEDDTYDDNLQTLQDAYDISNLDDSTIRFNALSVNGICRPQYETRMTHISDIPLELIMYIFKWVVSTELDMKSLDQLARVKKMSLHLHNVTGVYISKTSYVRPGERTLSFSYRPFHSVEYFRYMRFFVDGSVLLHTSADEPVTALARLKHKHGGGNPSVSVGHYRLSEDMVTIVLNRKPATDSHNQARGRKTRGPPSPILEQIFRMELKVSSTGRRRRHNRLTWAHYSVSTTYRSSGQTVCSEFDLNNQFPPLYFSVVKSFCNNAVAPLG